MNWTSWIEIGRRPLKRTTDKGPGYNRSWQVAEKSERLARTAHKIAQGGDVRTIGADAPGIDWQP